METVSGQIIVALSWANVLRLPRKSCAKGSHADTVFRTTSVMYRKPRLSTVRPSVCDGLSERRRKLKIMPIIIY